MPKPAAFSSQSAIVVGVDGGDTANGADEIYCYKLGRVRIRFYFHWQEDASVTCRVRVANLPSGMPTPGRYPI